MEVTGRLELECPICFEPFKTPIKVLQCGHSFCYHCIEEYFHPKQLNRCPTCRTETATDIDKIARNYTLENVIENMNEISTSSKSSPSAPKEASNDSGDCEDKKTTKITKTVKTEHGSKIEIDVEALQKVLKNPKYSNYPVAVYSIIGPYRSGKSFLLSCWTHFISRFREGNSDNVSTDDEAIEKWFEWKKGAKRFTLGIDITTEPFIVDLGEDQQQKIALFLMDTQGLFDNQSSTQNSVAIGTLSFLLSSLQCFNVRQQINDQLLDYIYKFAELSNKVKEASITEESSKVQKRPLVFVIRDWNDDDYAFGFDGGKTYFSDVTEPSEDQALEHSMRQSYFADAFEEIPCLLLPHPGSEIKKDPCKFGNLDQSFQRQLLNLFERYSIPGSFALKYDNFGQQMTCEQLCSYMEIFAALMQDGKEADDYKSFIQADWNAKMNLRVKECILKFQGFLHNNTEWLRKADEGEVERDLLSMIMRLLEEFDQVPFKGAEKFVFEWKDELDKLFTKIICGILICIKAEKEYVKQINRFYDWFQKNMAAGVYLTKKTKKQASEKREESLKKLKEMISNDHICEQCCEFFRIHVNKIIAETEEEVKKFMATLRDASICVGITVGAIVAAVVTPPAILISPAAGVLGAGAVASTFRTIRSGVRVANLLKDRSVDELELKIYDGGKVEIMLTFGTVSVDLND